MKQGLTGVNVADADDQLRIHDELFDGNRALARDAEQVGAIERRAQGFRRQFLQERVLLGSVLRPKQAAETAWVVKSQGLTAVEDQIPVFMRFWRRFATDEAQA